MRAIIAAGAAVFWLSGCAHLDTQIRQGLEHAQELAERCEALDRESPSFSFDALLARVESRLTLSCKEAGAACPFGVEQQLKSLRSELDKASVPKEQLDKKFDVLRDRLREFDAATKNFIASVNSDTARGSLTTSWEKARRTCRVAGNNIECNRSVAELVRGLQKQMRGLSDKADQVETAFQAVESSWESILADVGEINARLPMARQKLAVEISNVFEATRNSIQGIAEASIDEFRKSFFDRLLPTYTAERVLDFAERQFEPLDRLADKADAQFYMVGSVAIEWNRAPIQKSFDNFYVKYVRKEFRSTESARAFARAACIRLGKPTANGKASSIITPFLYSSMTLIEEEVRVKEDGGPISSRPGAQTPTFSIFDNPEVFNQCLAAERRIHRQLGETGQKSNSDAVRGGSQKACGEALLESEQRSALSSSPAAARSLATSEELKQLTTKVNSQVAKLSMETMNFAPPALSPPSPVAQVPPPPTPPFSPPLRASFCQKVAAGLPGVSCIENDSSVWIEFSESFATGMLDQPKLVPVLRQFGRLVEAHAKGAKMEVTGLASSAPLSCQQLRAASKGVNPCAWKTLESTCDEPNLRVAAKPAASRANELLGRARACWTADVIRGNAPSLTPPLVVVKGSGSAQAGDPSFDRMVSIRLDLNNDATIAETKP